MGDEVTILDAPTRSGYTFQYWKGSEYQPGDTYVVEGDHTFTAVWEKDAAKETTAEMKGGSSRRGIRGGPPCVLSRGCSASN